MKQTDKTAQLIDVPFYAAEAGLGFASARDAAEHFLALGQAKDLSPSPFILWGWIRAENPGLSGFAAFLDNPLLTPVHPALAREFYGYLCRAVDENLTALTVILSRAEVVGVQLLPRMAEAAHAQGHRGLRAFLIGLSARQAADPQLEMEDFSSAWYLDAYDDVRIAGANPFRHYVVSGWREGRDPSPGFSTAGYLTDHPDVARSGANPLIHFLDRGGREGRSVRRSTAYFSLVCHAARRGRLPRPYVPFESIDGEALTGLGHELAGTSVVVAVPFYENEHLVAVACNALMTCGRELMAHGAAVILMNDSPGYAPLSEELESWANRLSNAGVQVVIFASSQNRGFVQSANVGLRLAEYLSCPCLLLNSDAALQPGSLSEMLRVAALDDRFCFVNPLSNNATIATFGLEPNTDISDAARQHASIVSALPSHLIVPTCVGFCLLVRPEVIKLFGYFDLAYGLGYNEENDYIMRANRAGYLAVLAPRAFVGHIGEQSFSSSERTARESQNRVLLLTRYPEFEAATAQYFRSSDAEVRRIVERSVGAVDFVIDASHLPSVANGTSVLARRLVARIVRHLGPARCAVRTSSENLCWLNLEGMIGLQLWEPDRCGYAKVAIQLSQPFSAKRLQPMASQAMKVVFFMLDTIADDCLYLKEEAVHDLWEWIAAFADGLVFNSPYTMEKFNRRFDVRPEAIQLASYHSLDRRDYAHAVYPEDAERTVADRSFVLVVGNYFQHKAVMMAVEAIETIDVVKVVLGMTMDRKDCLGFDSGTMTERDIALLYTSAAVVLFPSLYEGFGFPLLESLASSKTVIVNRNTLTEDIARRLGHPPNILFFAAYSEIRPLVEEGLARAHGAIPGDGGHGDGWERSASEISAALERVLALPPEYRSVHRRQKALALLASRKR